MPQRRRAKEPEESELAAALGRAHAAWQAIVAAVGARHAPLELAWKPSKSAFGSMCLLRHGQRTLLYLTPDQGRVVVAAVLGERAVAAALASKLPARIKALLTEARPYAEGRGIRFEVRTARDAAMVAALVDLKTAPR